MQRSKATEKLYCFYQHPTFVQYKMNSLVDLFVSLRKKFLPKNFRERALLSNSLKLLKLDVFWRKKVFPKETKRELNKIMNIVQYIQDLDNAPWDKITILLFYNGCALCLIAFF